MIRILFLAANPVDQARLRVRNEFNGVRQVLDATAKRDRFQLIPEFDATPDELQDLLTRHRPQIVHFSGHGTAAGLLFADQDGEGQLVAPQTLRDLFGSFNETVRCVVLNACSSEPQARAIAGVVDAVVGMGDVVSDDGALAFATAFYRALTSGATLATAMDRARNQIDLAGLAEVDTPQLRAERIDAEQVRVVDWNDETNTSSATSGSIYGHFYTNKHFFGRDDELATLHDLLQSETNVSICPTITGMGGLGKTQLAAHYAHAHIADYPAGIFWITAADLNNIRPQLADFCVALNLPVADPQRTGDLTEQKISAFKAYLDGHPQALLIFDNVEEPDHLRTRQIGIGFTALTLGGNVLVTTRRRKLPGDHFAELPLERLLPEPAHQILTTPRPDLATDPDLDRLCEQFGYLPLMLNLAASALAKRGGAIAGYLSKLHEWGIDTLHDRARVSLADYHTSLTAVLQEQWAMLTSDDARLLLRVAGQLPEAEVIPTARLGLLAGLRDVDEWECPLRDGVEELERASLVEMVDGETVRLHPLIREFAKTLTPPSELEFLRVACAERLAATFQDLASLGLEYERRGIAALILDLLTAIDLCNSNGSIGSTSPDIAPASRPANKGVLTTLYDILRRLRLEAYHLQYIRERRKATQLLQQLLTNTGNASANMITQELKRLLRRSLHWLPYWSHKHQSLAVEQTLTGHKAGVLGIAVIDANRVVSASSDRTLKVWNLRSGTIEQTLTGHKDSIRCVVVFDANHVVSASYDRTLKVWNLQSGTVEQTLTGHEDSVRSVAVLDANRIVSASYDRTLKVWNLQSGTVEQTLTGHEDWVNGIAVLDIERIVSASSDRTLKVWNLQSGTVEQTLTGHEDSVRSVAVLDVDRIVSASSDRTLKVWNLQSGSVEKTLTGHEGSIRSVAVLDSNRVVSASYDRTLKVWNVQSSAVEQSLAGHSDMHNNSVTVIDTNRIVSASSDRAIRVWNLQSGAVGQTLHGHDDWVRSVAALNTNCIVSASYDRTLKVWNLKNGTLSQTFVGHDDSVLSVAVLDTNRIISGSSDRTLKIWNLQSGVAEQTLIGHKSGVLGVAMFDPNHIVSASTDRTLKVWNLKGGMVEQTLIGHDDSVRSVAVIDANRIVSGSDDHTLKVWNLQSGAVEQTLIGHKSGVRSVAVLDSKRIVSASYDHTLKVWNLLTGLVEQTLTGHDRRVPGVAVVDANRIVSASSDRTLKVWDLQTGQVIASIGLDGALQCVAVTRHDGHTLVVAGDAGGALYCLELVEPVGQ